MKIEYTFEKWKRFLTTLWNSHGIQFWRVILCFFTKICKFLNGLTYQNLSNSIIILILNHSCQILQNSWFTTPLKRLFWGGVSQNSNFLCENWQYSQKIFLVTYVFNTRFWTKFFFRHHPPFTPHWRHASGISAIFLAKMGVFCLIFEALFSHYCKMSW